MARLILHGRAGSPGAGCGRLVHLRPAELTHTPANPCVRDRDGEQDRLRAALTQASTELAELAEATRTRAGAETAAIFEAQALFVTDPALVDQALAAITENGVDAAQAILFAADSQSDVLAALEDEYFRARAADIRDVGKRVAAILSGTTRPSLHTASGEPAVVAADDLDASLVAELRRELVAGVALAGARRQDTRQSSPGRSASRLRSASEQHSRMLPRARRFW